jgi:Fanconi anemia group M protein
MRNFPDVLEHSICEAKGLDLLTMISPKGGEVVSFGVQRKTIPNDLIASVMDGRLQRELAMALNSGVDVRILLLEGPRRFNADGFMYDKVPRFHSGWTEKEFNNLLRSVTLQFGVICEFSENIEASIECLRSWIDYLGRRHVSLFTRPKIRSEWNTRLTVEQQKSFILQGFPGISATLAERILKHFGGLPLKWTCTEEELTEVHGIGKLTAKKLMEIASGESRMDSRSGQEDN